MSQRYHRSSSYSGSTGYGSSRGFDSDDIMMFGFLVLVAAAVLYFFSRKTDDKKKRDDADGGVDNPASASRSNTNVFMEKSRRKMAAAASSPPEYQEPAPYTTFPRMANSQLTREDAAGRDYVLAIDISGSMLTDDCPNGGIRFTEASEGAIAFAECIEKLDPDGIDICLFNDRMRWTCNAKSNVVRDVFASQGPAGGTLLAPVLRRAFENYFAKRTRPLTIVVVTDGCPQDKAEVVETLVWASRRLHAVGGQDSDLGVSLVQIGYDKLATAFLKELDNDLQSQYGCPFDIVDTVNMAEVAQRGGIKQVLLDAVND